MNLQYIYCGWLLCLNIWRFSAIFSLWLRPAELGSRLYQPQYISSEWSSIVKNCWIYLSYAFAKLIYFQGVYLKIYWFENRCVVMRIDLYYGADLMIIASTLDTWWELLPWHQCLAEDSGPAAVDHAAEATPAGSGASDGLGCRCCGRALFQEGSSKETRREIRINLLMLELVCALVNSKSAAFRRRRACRIHETKKS